MPPRKRKAKQYCHGCGREFSLSHFHQHLSTNSKCYHGYNAANVASQHHVNQKTKRVASEQLQPNNFILRLPTDMVTQAQSPIREEEFENVYEEGKVDTNDGNSFDGISLQSHNDDTGANPELGGFLNGLPVIQVCRQIKAGSKAVGNHQESDDDNNDDNEAKDDESDDGEDDDEEEEDDDDDMDEDDDDEEHCENSEQFSREALPPIDDGNSYIGCNSDDDDTLLLEEQLPPMSNIQQWEAEDALEEMAEDHMDMDNMSTDAAMQHEPSDNLLTDTHSLDKLLGREIPKNLDDYRPTGLRENAEIERIELLQLRKLFPGGLCRGNPYSNRDIGVLKLLQFFKDIEAPVNAFDRLADILHELGSKLNFDFEVKLARRATYLKQYERTENCTKHKETKVKLETATNAMQSAIDQDQTDRDASTITCTFDAEEQIISLLSDDALFKDMSMLNVDPTNPFGHYKHSQGEDGRVDDVCDGDWHDLAMTSKGLKYEDQFTKVLPIILYSDKTGTDAKQRNAGEPVVLTLGLFKTHLRNLPSRCFRILGYVTDTDQKSIAKKADDRSGKLGLGRSVRNLQIQLNVILQTLVNLTGKPIYFPLLVGNEGRRWVKFIPLMCMFLGDIKSQDALLGRYAGHTKGLKAHMYMCDCLQTDLDKARKNHLSQNHTARVQDDNNASRPCNLITMEDRKKILDGSLHYTCDNMDGLPELLVELKKISQHRCWPSLFDLDYGDNVHGAYAACVMDTLHSLRLGIILYVCRQFVVNLPLTQRAAYDTLMDRTTGTNHRTSLSARNLRTNYTKGVTNLTLLTASEWPGILLSYVIGSVFYQGAAILNNRKKKQNKKGGQQRKAPGEQQPGDEDYYCSTEEFIKLAEDLLCFDAFVSNGTMWKKTDKDAPAELQGTLDNILKRLTTKLPRDNGNGWQIPKIHSMLQHMTEQISRFGHPRNANCNVGEKGLVNWMKCHGRRAQKGSTEEYITSVARHVHTDQVLQQAQRRVAKYLPNFFPSFAAEIARAKLRQEGKEFDANVNDRDSFLGNTKFKISRNDLRVVEAKWTGSPRPNKVVPILHPSILSYFTEMYFDGIDTGNDVEVEVFTEFVTEKLEPIRAHPDYKRRLGSNGAHAWNDFGVIIDPLYKNEAYKEFYGGSFGLTPAIQFVDRDNELIPNDNDEDINADMVEETEIALENIGLSANMSRLPHHIAKARESALSGMHEGKVDVVPAKIMAFYLEPKGSKRGEPGTKMMVVHPCSRQMNVNMIRSSVLCDSWNLQFIKQRDVHAKDASGVDIYERHPKSRLFRYDRGGNKIPYYQDILIPMYCSVPTSQLLGPILAYEESPGVFESVVSDANYIGHVVSVTDRLVAWAKEILNR